MNLFAAHHGALNDAADPAEAVGTLAVRALQIDGAGGLPVEPAGVEPGGVALDAGKAGGHIRYDLIFSRDDDDLIRAVEHIAHPVAPAVDVDQLAILSDGVGAAYIHIRRVFLEKDIGVLGERGMGVAVHGIALILQCLVETHAVNCHGAPETHGSPSDLLQRGLLGLR